MCSVELSRLFLVRTSIANVFLSTVWARCKRGLVCHRLNLEPHVCWSIHDPWRTFCTKHWNITGEKKNKKKTGHTLIFPAASSKASLCSEAFRWVYNEKNIKSQGQKNTNNHKHVEASTMNPETPSFCHKQHNKYIWKEMFLSFLWASIFSVFMQWQQCQFVPSLNKKTPELKSKNQISS